ncbi:outer membrane protein assembly factor BamB family protein [Rhodococcoides yunnanense]|uniref:PQQ-binding-like beta-propeller repeat protein n=1 Tax=Rhodococcoides yunnanense TaxID=278209 RepID=A0ABU4B9E1_9NOCA|nr:PQQ-binding-like beta-propeller repeat protein [Rhodococcus yunnanensis]MDV6260805.1 PQQ-binding-like beta-propeller repeat protein [Rhodococcus yunnanensis]
MTRRSQLSAAAVVLATTIACAACATEKQPPPAGTPVDGATGAAPGLGWTLSPSDLDVSDGQFRDPVRGSETDSMESGSITDGSTVVTLIGRPDGREYLDAALVGLDIADGAVRWRVPADDIVGCGKEFVDEQIVCYRGRGSGSEILTVDGETGESTTRDATFSITNLTTSGGHVYTSHSADDDDAEPTVSRGTADALDADWSVQFDSANPQSVSTLHTENGIGLFDDDQGLFAFDLDTGDNLWSRTAPDCARSGAASLDGRVRVVRTDCSDPSTVTGSEVVDTDGTAVAATDSVTVQQPTFDSPSEAGPVLLGTGGYQPPNPDPVWTNDGLVWAVPADISEPAAKFLATNGLAYAVAGSVALLRNNDTATESAIDLDTGATLWSRESGEFAEVGALDGGVATLFGPEVLRGIDVRTGSTVWDIPTTALYDEGIDLQSWPMFDRVDADSIYTDSIYTRALSISVLRAT